MVDFAHILGEVERRSNEAGNFASHEDVRLAPLLEVTQFDNSVSPELTGARSRLANKFYASSEPMDSGRCHTKAVGQKKFKLTASELHQLMVRLNDRALSLEDLRALRRELAWRFHPDRLALEDSGEACGVMAQLNARIDGLIEGKKSSRLAKKP
ncbi:hypothetical protein OGR47_01690 [Methylocystis sp. MJC1]|jgi:hypothetical protein|uniref:hypothetical protein n=1 Tax=Methylocystis sp. MJC1 TaxID=2654282 RepID=UPI0013EB36EE|nr:hypothetical protein [Methylocystis sp. MJC1]KAF2990614.1 hypothetical protein MJC1_02377 [Methylocystis sp. MJC1]MBU6525725.1 hypothetical protein [Methylocystis sp. MJC1]UZX12196.1 hypothetical protein OGR47_01690 [Methylocystis sp. MJC1]